MWYQSTTVCSECSCTTVRLRIQIWFRGSRVLRWSPLAASQAEIIFKVGVFGYKAIHGLAPPYLKELFVPVSSVSALSRNRSASRGDFIVPPATRNTTYRQRSFAVAGPTWWNYFSLQIRNSSCMQTFRSRLKTFLFREAYNISASYRIVWFSWTLADLWTFIIIYMSVTYRM